MRQHKPPHVGEFIKEVYLEPYKQKLSRSEVARHLNVSRSTFNRLVTEESDLSPEMALRLSKVLGGSPESWLNMQSGYSLSQAAESVDLSLTSPLNLANYSV